jgi:hypothetical protein
MVASNGRPAFTSSGFYVFALAPLIILARGPVQLLNLGLRRDHAWILLSLTAFAIANLLSTLATPTFEAWEALVERCLLPLLAYLAIVGIRLSPSDMQSLLRAFALGSAVIFVHGLIAYVREWGIPDLQTIMWARYDVARMAGYSDATMGNVGRVGGFVVLIVPTVVIAAINWSRSRTERVFYIVVASLGIANLIVSGSRTGIAILLVSASLIMISLGIKRASIGIAALVGLVLLTSPLWIDIIVDESFVSRYLPTYGAYGVDRSAEERLDSIVIGWHVFINNFVLGVGPSMSPYHNFYSVPHQSFVHQFSELGFVGGLSFIWLTIAVIGATINNAFRTQADRTSGYRFLWLIGPGSWLFLGAAGGISFNLGFALGWIGIAHAMLALSTARVDFRSR